MRDSEENKGGLGADEGLIKKCELSGFKKNCFMGNWLGIGVYREVGGRQEVGLLDQLPSLSVSSYVCLSLSLVHACTHSLFSLTAHW